jgi:hypothetical protein
VGETGGLHEPSFCCRGDGGLRLIVGPNAGAAERSLAIKNGETLELGRLYFISSCKSILNSPPTAEILDGPPQLSLSVKEAQVQARAQGCAKPVPGAIMSLTAKDVTEIATGRVILRIKYSTKDGDRSRSDTLNVTMVP